MIRRVCAHLVAALLLGAGLHPLASAQSTDTPRAGAEPVLLGPRPLFLVDDLADGPLKQRLEACARQPARSTRFSIGHRGAALQFPEHTRESYLAAARMGAGIIECDVVFTRDRALVCRHAQNDLAVTTDILLTPLAETCIQPFEPAQFDANGGLLSPATAECRTSDITVAEFKTLRGKMDGFDPRARTAEEFVRGTPGWRTDLYSGPTSGSLMTHVESIALFAELEVGMTPELKTPTVSMPFQGLTHDQLRQQLIDEYKAAGIAPAEVWPQSFDERDVAYWIEHEPEFGQQAVLLRDAADPFDLPTSEELARYARGGIRIVAPPLFALLALDDAGGIVPSRFARDARAAGLDLIPWTFERSGLLTAGGGSYYYQTVMSAISHEGDLYRVLDVLAQQVGVKAVFSDWPAPVTYYANCVGR